MMIQVERHENQAPHVEIELKTHAEGVALSVGVTGLTIEME